MKKLIIIALLLASLYIIQNLVRSIYNFWSKQDLFVAAQIDLKQKKEENERLKKEVERVKDPDFIEKEAREKLFLVKPGERIVLLPTTNNDSTQSAYKQQKREANWKQWLHLFL